MLKKIFLGIVVVVVLAVGVLVAIPFLYSVDQFRPQIKAAIEKNIRGKVDLGKLSLSLIPRVELAIDGLTITAPAPFDKQPFVTVKTVQVQMPLMSLLTAPNATILVGDPVIKLVSLGDKSSITELLPPKDPSAPPPPPAQAPQAALGETLKGLPPWLVTRVQAARMAFEMRDAGVSLQKLDGPKGDRTELSKLNVALKDIGLASPMGLHVDGDVAIVKGAIQVAGAMATEGTITFKPVGKNYEIDLDVTENLDGLDIAMKPLFHKPQGTAMGGEIKGHISQSPERTEVDLGTLAFRFNNVRTAGTAKIVADAKDPTQGSVNMGLRVKDFELGAFGALIPLVRDFKLGGKVNVDLDVNGSFKDPTLGVEINLAGVTGATPQLKKPITDLHGRIVVQGKVASPTVTVDPFALKIGGSDMAVKLSTQGLDPIAVNLAVVSSKLDADELLGIQPPAPVAAKADPKSAAAPAAPAVPLDESLNALAPTVEEALKNPFLDKATATVSMNFQWIKIMAAEFTHATLNLTYNKRKLTVSKTGIDGYGGHVLFDMDLDLNNPAALGYRVNAGLQDVKIERVTAAHAPAWKDEMTGAIDGTFKVAGAGLRREQLNSSLVGGLSGKVKQGRTSLPVVKLVAGIMEKIPNVGGKPLQLPANAKNKSFNGEFKTCDLDTSIKGRLVNLNNLDVTYNTGNLGIGDMEFKANGTVTFDRQVEMLGTAFLAPEVVRIPELKGPSGKIEIPLKLKGDMSNPQPDYAYSLKILGERLLKNKFGAKLDQAKAAAQQALDKAKAQAQAEADKAKAKAQADAQKAASDALSKAAAKAPAPVQKGLQDLKKKLKF